MVVSDMKKALRTNKVFVDWSQNDDHKTTVTVYSLRAKQQPSVSTPLEWAEVEKCLKKKDPKVLVFETEDTLKRCEKMGDLFEPVLTKKQRLPELSALGVEPVKARRNRTATPRPRSGSKSKTG